MAKTTNPTSDLFDLPDTPASSTAADEARSTRRDDAKGSGRDNAESAAYVSQIMRTENIDIEAAWAFYEREVARFMNIPHDDATVETPAKGNNAHSNNTASSAVRRAGSPVNPSNGASNALYEQLIPKHLRDQHASMSESLKRGLVPDVGHNDDQVLLQNAMQEKMQLETMNVDGPHPFMDEVLQRNLVFPYTPKYQRNVPVDWCVSSLIHVGSNNKPRRQYKQTPMGAIGNKIEVIYTGEELRDDDEDFLYQLLYLASGSMPGTWIDISRSEFISAAKGKDTRYSRKDADQLAESILRMRGGYIIVWNKHTNVVKDTGIITGIRGGPKSMQVLLDPNIVVMMKTYTPMNLRILHKLRDIPRALFKYLSTLRITAPWPTKVLSYFELCYGQSATLIEEYMKDNPTATQAQANFSLTKKLSNFRRQGLPKALQVLQDEGLIVSFHIDYKTDKVAVIKSPEWLAKEREESGLQNADPQDNATATEQDTAKPPVADQ